MTFDQVKDLDIYKLSESLDDKYVEIQVFGKLNHGIDIIKEVYFSKTPSEEIINKLKEHGIKYTIIEAGE